MAKDDVQTNIRLPAVLKDQLQDAAAASGRTFTAEMVHRLNSTFESPLQLLLENRLRESAVISREIAMQVQRLDAMVRSNAPVEALERVKGVLQELRHHELMIGNTLLDLTGSLNPEPSAAPTKAAGKAKK